MSDRRFDYVADGQITMFDFINIVNEKQPLKQIEVPLLNIGDIVYKVSMCDIEKYIISGTFTVRNQNRYHGNEDTMEKGGCCFGENDIGQNYFLSIDDAIKKTIENKLLCDVIFSDEMKIENQQVFLSVRFKWFRNDNHNIFGSTIAIVNKTFVYVALSGLYHFMHSFKTEELAKNFYKSELKKFDGMIKTNIGMKLNNMYLCKDGRYSEANYYMSGNYIPSKILSEELEDEECED